MKIIHWIVDAAVAIVAFFLLMILTACGGGGEGGPEESPAALPPFCDQVAVAGCVPRAVPCAGNPGMCGGH